MKMYELSLLDKRNEYNNVFTFSFTSEEKIDFIAGQSTHLGFPTGQKDKTKVHHMSFASAPQDDHYEFSMDTGSPSWYKQKMLTLNPGDIVKCFKIHGDFVLHPDDGKQIIFLTGGIGITPVRSIIRSESHSKNPHEWKLMHVSRDKFLYEEELSKYPNKQWRVNRANVDVIWEEVLEDCNNSTFYISGSENFVQGMISRLKESNISNIVTEDFSH